VLTRPALRSYAGRDVVAGMRPEHLPAAPPDYAGAVLAGDVDLVEQLARPDAPRPRRDTRLAALTVSYGVFSTLIRSSTWVTPGADQEAAST
jgi:hypothetical protein